MSEQEYEVSVSNIFLATDPQDALAQMTSWIDEAVYVAGYRVKNNDTGESWFIDAEDGSVFDYKEGNDGD